VQSHVRVVALAVMVVVGVVMMVVVVVVEVGFEVVAVAIALVVLDDVGVGGGDGAGILQVVMLRHVFVAHTPHHHTHPRLQVLDDHRAVTEVGGAGADEVRAGGGEGGRLLTTHKIRPQLGRDVVTDDHLLHQLGIVVKVTTAGGVAVEGALTAADQLATASTAATTTTGTHTAVDAAAACVVVMRLPALLTVHTLHGQAAVEPAATHTEQHKHHYDEDKQDDEEDDDDDDAGLQGGRGGNGNHAAVVGFPVGRTQVPIATRVVGAQGAAASGNGACGHDLVAIR
jgi:hypothetical protein